MKEPEPTDIIAFLFCLFLLFTIIVATFVNPAPPDMGYKVISTRSDGSPLYMEDTKTGTVFYVDSHGKKINVIVYSR